MKNILKLITVIFIGSIAYVALIQFFLIFLDLNTRNDINWGIYIHYSYFIFGLTLLLSVFAKMFRQKVFYLTIAFLSIIAFITYWIDGFNIYPNKTMLIVFTGIVIYMLSHLYLNRSKSA